MSQEDTPKKTNRSNRSASPHVDEDQESPISTESNQRTTRSQSIDSTSSDTKKRKRKSTGKDDSERETRTSRNTKEARDAKKTKREIIMKERLHNRLDELDKLEEAVKNGTHHEYHQLLQKMEEKKKRMTQVAEMRRSFAEKNVINFFHAQKYAADSQFNWDKLALRRSMIQHVQHKINILEQEYYSNHISSSLDEEHLTEWVPPDRPSMISSLALGLSEEDAENDVELAKEEYHVHKGYRPSPPLDMLASLADHQQKDFSSLNPWTRPTLPT